MTATPTYPIIFSAPMIRALLDGRKTQTRRTAWKVAPVKCGPCEGTGAVPHRGYHGTCEWCGGTGYTEGKPSPWQRRLDRWREGERPWLWVRETWKPRSSVQPCAATPAIYRAEYTFPKIAAGLGPWRPSIHQPRWASRLSLQVTNMRLERLQDISVLGCYQEAALERPNPKGLGSEMTERQNARREFRALWTSIHSPESWEANPEVIATTFEVHQQNIDAVERAP